MQAPLFMQQYSHQLVGREAELHRQVNAMTEAAVLSGKTLQQLINKFLQNSDLDIMRQGELMRTTVDRWHQLADSLSALQASSIYARPFVFLTHLDADIFKSTLDHFTFGIPMTLEGGIYALLGIVISYTLVSAVRNIFVSARRHKNKIVNPDI